jgi:hypothetical protein
MSEPLLGAGGASTKESGGKEKEEEAECLDWEAQSRLISRYFRFLRSNCSKFLETQGSKVD